MTSPERDDDDSDEEVLDPVEEITEVAEPCREGEPSIGLPKELQEGDAGEGTDGDDVGDSELESDVPDAVAEIQELAEPSREAEPSIGQPEEIKERDGDE